MSTTENLLLGFGALVIGVVVLCISIYDPTRVLERIFSVYAQSILGQSWVLGITVPIGLFVGSAWVMKTDVFSIHKYT